jgi:glycyl-tRNA synthetase alpha chain
LQYSVYNFEEADVDRLWAHFNSYEAEAQALLARADTLLADEKAVSRRSGASRCGRLTSWR